MQPVIFKEARKILSDARIPLRDRNQIIKSFELESFRVERTTSNLTGLRTFDDGVAKLEGRYVFGNLLENQTDRITKLALPMNSATRLGVVNIPKDSLVFTGKVAPQVRFSKGLTGGENQTFLLGNLLRYSFYEVMMPRNLKAIS